MNYRYANKDKTEIVSEDGLTTIPVNLANSDYADLVKRKVKIADFLVPPRYPDLQTALSVMIEWIDKFNETLTEHISLLEQLGWAAKEEVALAFVAGTASQEQVAMLAAETNITGETTATLANAIIAKASRFRVISATMAGLRRKTKQALVAVTDPQDYETVLLDARQQAETLAATIG